MWAKLSALALVSILVHTVPAFAACADDPHVTRDGERWAIAPSGGDDGPNFQCVLDEATASGGPTEIVLGPGRFYMNEVYAVGFHGTIRGADRELTRIDVLRALDPDGPGVDRLDIDALPPAGPEPYPWMALWLFLEGDVTVRDLTFEITAAEPAEPWPLHLLGPELTSLSPLLAMYGGQLDATVENVTFRESHPGAIRHALTFEGLDHEWVEDGELHRFVEPLRGHQKVMGCSFEHFGAAMFSGALTDGTLEVVGNRYRSALAFLAEWGSGSQYRVVANDIETVTGNGAFVGVSPSGIVHPPNEPAGPIAENRLLFAGNTVRQPGGGFWAGVELWDGTGGLLRADILGNHFISHDQNVPWGPIFSFDVHDATVVGNLVEGTGPAAFYVGFFGTPDSGWWIAGNDFAGFDATFAPVYFGPNTSGHTYVGDADDVLDDGDNEIKGDGE